MRKTTGKSKSWITTKTHRSVSFHLFKGLVSRIHGSLSRKRSHMWVNDFLKSLVFERLLLTEELPKNFSSFFFFFNLKTPFAASTMKHLLINWGCLLIVPFCCIFQPTDTQRKLLQRWDEYTDLMKLCWAEGPDIVSPVLEYFFFWVPRTWSFSLKCPLIPIREPLVKKIAC